MQGVSPTRSATTVPSCSSSSSAVRISCCGTSSSLSAKGTNSSVGKPQWPSSIASNIPSQAVRVIRHDLNGIGAIGLEDPHGPGGTNSVAVQEDHDFAHGL